MHGWRSCQFDTCFCQCISADRPHKARHGHGRRGRQQIWPQMARIDADADSRTHRSRQQTWPQMAQIHGHRHRGRQQIWAQMARIDTDADARTHRPPADLGTDGADRHGRRHGRSSRQHSPRSGRGAHRRLPLTGLAAVVDRHPATAVRWARRAAPAGPKPCIRSSSAQSAAAGNPLSHTPLKNPAAGGGILCYGGRSPLPHTPSQRAEDQSIRVPERSEIRSGGWGQHNPKAAVRAVDADRAVSCSERRSACGTHRVADALPCTTRNVAPAASSRPSAGSYGYGVRSRCASTPTRCRSCPRRRRDWRRAILFHRRRVIHLPPKLHSSSVGDWLPHG